MSPRVSIVMPSFNQARFVREALDSVLSQDHAPLEVLVVDGGSRDGTIEILKEYGDRIAWISEPDRGQSDAINKGFRRASGEIVAWLNTDDRYAPGAVRAAVAALEQRPEAALVYGDGELIGEDGRLLGTFPATQDFDLWKLVWVSDYIMQPTVFMRREALAAVGYLDESLHYAMDWDLWVRLACRWPAVRLGRVLAQTREYAATKTASGGWRRLAELRRLMARHGAKGWPPGAIAYGLDTLRRRWPLVFGASTLGDVEALARRPLARWFRPLHHLLVRIIDQQISHAQGVWADGWAGPLAHQAVPWNGQAGRVVVRGDVPADPALLPLRLSIEAEQARATLLCQQPGPFEAALELPAAAAAPRALPVTVRASRSVRAPRDSRRLSWRLREVHFVAAGAGA